MRLLLLEFRKESRIEITAEISLNHDVNGNYSKKPHCITHRLRGNTGIVVFMMTCIQTL